MQPHIDQLRLQLRDVLKKFKKQHYSNCSPDEQRAFEILFWKLIPHLQVDLNLYNKSIRVYDPPTPPEERLQVTGEGK